MSDPSRTKQELLEENFALKKRIQELEISDAERKKAKGEALMATQNLQSLLMNAKGFFIYQVAPDPTNPYGAKVVLVSPSITDVTGITDVYNFGAWFENIHPDDMSRIVAANRRSLETRESYDEVARWRHQLRKEWLWVRTISTPVYDHLGQLLHFNGLCVDITERMRAEEALRESEEKTNALIRYAPTAVYELNYEGTRFISVNDAMCQNLGYTREELLLMNPSALLDENSRALFADRVRRQLTGQKIEEAVEYKVRKKDGSFIDAILYVSLNPGGGKPGHTMVIAHDITERKQAEKKLNESERLYRAIGESIDYGIWVCDPEGRNTYASESFLNLVGLTQDQCSEFGWGDVLHPEDAERTIAAWKECVRTGGKWDIEHRYRGVDGKWHPILARGVPVRDEQGKVICWAGINLDISGLKRMEEDLRRSRDELESRVKERTEELARSQQRLQQLASQLLLAQEKERRRVAVELHDGLLSELAATKYLLEGKIMLLQKGNLSDPGELKRVVDILATTMQEARRIMNNLHPSVLDELGLIAALNWSVGEYQKAYPHIGFETKIEVSEQDISESIRIVIFRVLQEALNNFARHGKGDRVELSLSKTEGTLTLMIRDNGKGFDVKKVARGLGLESMRERVELSGGAFQIESMIGKGTTIRATWSI